MDEKRCSTCHLVRPLKDFNVRRRSKDGRQPRCRSCWQAWYAAHRAAHIDDVTRRKTAVRAEHQRRLAEYLADHPCVDCGEQDLRVLDFDHDDPEGKLADVSRLASMHIAWDRIEAEIEKCSVRCANCHRRRTAEMFGYWRDAVERDRRTALTERAHSRLVSILGAPA